MNRIEHRPRARPVDDSEAAGLWSEFAARRDPLLRAALCERYLPYARAIAADIYAARTVFDVEFTDYMHCAVLGLIEALDRFDPARNVRFQTFAAYRIRGALLNSLPHWSERHEQLALRARWRKQRGEASADAPYRRQIEMPVDAVAGMAVGLAIGYLLEGTGMFMEPGEAHQEDCYARCALGETQNRIRESVELLPDRERAVVKYHYYCGLTLEQIGGLMQISKSRAAQIHRRALGALRALHEQAAPLHVGL